MPTFNANDAILEEAATETAVEGSGSETDDTSAEFEDTTADEEEGYAESEQDSANTEPAEKPDVDYQQKYNDLESHVKKNILPSIKMGESMQYMLKEAMSGNRKPLNDLLSRLPSEADKSEPQQDTEKAERNHVESYLDALVGAGAKDIKEPFLKAIESIIKPMIEEMRGKYDPIIGRMGQNFQDTTVKELTAELGEGFKQAHESGVLQKVMKRMNVDMKSAFMLLDYQRMKQGTANSGMLKKKQANKGMKPGSRKSGKASKTPKFKDFGECFDFTMAQGSK